MCEKKKGRKKTRKMEQKENESGDKKQLGHWIWGGEIVKRQTLQSFHRDGLLLLTTVCQGGLIGSLSLLFKICLFKVTMMSLNISQALLPFRVSFRFQDCCHCVCHSPLQATRDVYLDAGRPRSGPPRKGWSESLVCAMEGSSSVRVTRFTHAHPPFS